MLRLRVADAADQDRQQREGELRMTFEDPAEVPALDAQRGRRLDGAGARRARELVEERHLSEDIARSERRELDLFAALVLDDVDLAGTNDERADAGVALTHDLLPGLVALLDRSVRDRIERLLVEILEPADFLEEFGADRHDGGMVMVREILRTCVVPDRDRARYRRLHGDRADPAGGMERRRRRPAAAAPRGRAQRWVRRSRLCRW